MELINVYKELLKTVGKSVEEIGKSLARDEEFTNEELQDLENALLRSANTVKQIRDGTSGKG
jgi:predicted transcriptional regulator